jgi:hypothetical protein
MQQLKTEKLTFLEPRTGQPGTAAVFDRRLHLGLPIRQQMA